MNTHDYELFVYSQLYLEKPTTLKCYKPKRGRGGRRNQKRRRRVERRMRAACDAWWDEWWALP